MRLHLLLLVFFLSGCLPFNGKDKSIPDIQLLLIDSSTTLNLKNVISEGPFVLAYFKPDCRMCQEEVKDWIDNMEILRGVKFYLITTESLDQIRLFDEIYGVSKLPNMKVGMDVDSVFRKFYNPTTIPYVLLCDNHGVVRAIFSGGASSSRLASFIKEMKSKKISI